MAVSLLLAVIFCSIGAAVALYMQPDPLQLRYLRRVVRRGGGGDDGVQLPRTSLLVAASELIEQLLSRRVLAQRLRERLQSADVQLRPGEFLLMAAGLLLGGLLIGRMVFAPVGMLLGAGLGVAAPWIWLGRRRLARQGQIVAALPDLLGSTANGLRSGFSLLQALEAGIRHAPGVLGREIQRLLSEVRVGVPFEDALTLLAERVDSRDLDLMVAAIQIQRQVGGNLAEVLDRIQGTIRERVRLQGEVRALTAQGRLSGFIIGLLPIAMLMVMLTLAPNLVQPLFSTSLGHVMLAIGAVLQGVGVLILRRIVRIEV